MLPTRKLSMVVGAVLLFSALPISSAQAAAAVPSGHNQVTCLEITVSVDAVSGTENSQTAQCVESADVVAQANCGAGDWTAVALYCGLSSAVTRAAAGSNGDE